MVNNSWYKIVQINARRKLWIQLVVWKTEGLSMNIEIWQFLFKQVEKKTSHWFYALWANQQNIGQKNAGLHKFNLTGLQKLLELWFSVFS